jgi:hypothetical protein
VTINHMVLVKFKDDVPRDRVAAHVGALQSLKARVPGVVALSVGADFSNRADGFTHGLVVTLQDRAALQSYSAHPSHVEVANALRADAALLVLDYEF